MVFIVDVSFFRINPYYKYEYEWNFIRPETQKCILLIQRWREQYNFNSYKIKIILIRFPLIFNTVD
jgi:hypothetical protein